MTTTTDAASSAQPFDEWAIVELLGHRRLAGRIREVQIAGAGFLRLDIPASGNSPARTQYCAPGSVYAIHPVDEALAHAAVAAQWNSTPINRWELEALIPSPSATAATDPGGEPDDPDDPMPY